MNKAKYYIYWNLKRDCYSVRYKGKVIGHYTGLVAANVRFKVSEKGRQRVLAEQRKNVHAFVVADTIYPELDPLNVCDVSHFESVRYNPYCFSTFVDAYENPILSAGCVWLTNRFSLDKRKADIKVCR
jgi:hypothetical protein